MARVWRPAGPKYPRQAGDGAPEDTAGFSAGGTGCSRLAHYVTESARLGHRAATWPWHHELTTAFDHLLTLPRPAT